MGIEPTSAVWKTAVLPLNDAREKMEVESARLELASPGCKPGTLPLSYDPAQVGKESNLLPEFWRLSRSP
jgi:hypothetical protein